MLHAKTMAKLFIFLQHEKDEEKKSEYYGTRFFEIMMKNYPRLFSMNRKELCEEINFPDFKDILLLLRTKYYHLSREIMFWSPNNLTKKQELIKQCETYLNSLEKVYDRLVEPKESYIIKKTRSITIINSYTCFLSNMSDFHSKIGNYELGSEYLQRHNEVRGIFNDIFQKSLMKNKNEKGIDSSKIEKVNREIGILKSEIQELIFLYRQDKIKEALIMIKKLRKKEEFMDGMLKCTFLAVVAETLEKSGDIIKTFEAINVCLRAHLEEYGWNNLFTINLVLKRVAHLINAGEFKDAIKDLMRIKKADRNIEKKNEIFQDYLYAANFGLRVGYQKFLARYPEHRVYEALRKKIRAKTLENKGKYNNFRKCSNSQCSKTEDAKTSFKRCGRCKSRIYCSKVCQVQHWKVVHKKECQKIQMISKKVESDVDIFCFFLNNMERQTVKDM